MWLCHRSKSNRCAPGLRRLHRDTSLINNAALRRFRQPFLPTSVPIYQTATFEQTSATCMGAYDYSRSGNPTRAALETSLAQLESSEHCMAFASGVAALSCLLDLNPKRGVIAGDDLYGGTHRLLGHVRERRDVDVRLVDTTDLESVESALKDMSTRAMILVESPSNPGMKVTDIRGLAALAESYDALLAIDNSLMSAWCQKPLELGAHIVLLSATKLIGGHADTTAGALLTNDGDLAERLQFLQNAHGNALAPFDSFLLLRGLKTLGVRLEKQQQNAQSVAEFLQKHHLVDQVNYVGLLSHPQHTLHRSQSSGDGSLLSFSPSPQCDAVALVESLSVFTKAVSFGGVGSVASLPLHFSHASIPDSLRQLPANLVRLGCGIENVSDLVCDLEKALWRSVGLDATTLKLEATVAATVASEGAVPLSVSPAVPQHTASVEASAPLTPSGKKVPKRQRFSDTVATPIAQTSAYFFENTDQLVDFCQGKYRSFEYGRYGNPTTRTLEEKLAELECAEDCLFFSSGMSAATTSLMALVPEGGHIVSTKDAYRRTRQFMQTVLPKMRITMSIVDMGDMDALQKVLLEEQPSIFFSESPTNPYLRCVDVPLIKEMCHSTGTRVVIDSTFSTPVNQKALEQGADLVIHSATKYIAGHNDVLAGAIAGSEELVASVRALHNMLGGVLDPHAAYLCLRGLKTLGIRVRQQNDTAMKLAEVLSKHPMVERVHYPGLSSHPDHDIAMRLMNGFGGVVTFEVAGDRDLTSTFIDSLKVPFIAPSLGGVDTLVEQPSIISYYDYTPEQRRQQGIKDNLVRFSVGIEDDLVIVDDVLQSLDHIAKCRRRHPIHNCI